MSLPDGLAERLAHVLGPGGYLTDPHDTAPFCTGWRDGWTGQTSLVALPDTTEKVAEVVRLCYAARVPIVPQGGNTGLTGGSQPHDHGREIVLSTRRLNRIRALDLDNDTMTVEAGVVLQTIQEEAARHDRLFPLSLAAEGSCQIGGNLATNAGGTQVLRYGNARALVLGLEVVLADGRVWDGLRGLRKDNTGYDLKDLFIGAEGTLGIITAAVLRLFPRPTDVQTALVAVPSPTAAVALLTRLKAALGDQVTAFELIARICFDLALELIDGVQDPLAEPSPWYVLVEVAGHGEPGTLAEPLTDALGEAVEAGLVTDATLASSGDQRAQLWRVREEQAEVQKRAGASIKHDVSVPISRIPQFLDEAGAALTAAYPGARLVAFGHVGDGNLHYNPLQPKDADRDTFAREIGRINRIVHDLVVAHGGSISAEHGLGRLRRDEAAHYKSAVELDLMRRIKHALDPLDLMNPGKVLPPQG
ncbi:MAG: FAD-binding oxidoreductase [Geminicoccaceae bacterium]|nr:MAG: FAD-binding oxidoreductase [Geminicoccaceae bacterium]